MLGGVGGGEGRKTAAPGGTEFHSRGHCMVQPAAPLQDAAPPAVAIPINLTKRHLTMNIPKRLLRTVLLGLCLLATSLPDAAAQPLASGGWINKSYDIHGNWEITARGDERYLVFDEDFQTRRGPDLKVYLSTLSVAAVRDRTVATSSVEIAPLKSARGAQEYLIPAHLELADYRSVLIHCKAYSHLWGGGEIMP